MTEPFETAFEELLDRAVAQQIIAAPPAPPPKALTVAEMQTLVGKVHDELERAKRTVMCPPALEEDLRRSVHAAGLEHLINVTPTPLLEGQDHLLLIPNRIAEFDLPPPGAVFAPWDQEDPHEVARNLSQEEP